MHGKDIYMAGMLVLFGRAFVSLPAGRKRVEAGMGTKSNYGGEEDKRLLECALVLERLAFFTTSIVPRLLYRRPLSSPAVDWSPTHRNSLASLRGGCASHFDVATI